MAETHAFLRVPSQYVYTVRLRVTRWASTTYLAVSLTVTARKQPSVNYYTEHRCITHYSVAERCERCGWWLGYIVAPPHPIFVCMLAELFIAHLQLIFLHFKFSVFYKIKLLINTRISFGIQLLSAKVIWAFSGVLFLKRFVRS